MTRLIISAILFLTLAVPSLATDLTLTNTPAQVYFSPHDGCTDAIVMEIGMSKSEILVQAYSFTSKEIAKALVDAHKGGVRTEISLDRSNKNKKIFTRRFYRPHGSNDLH